MFHFVFTDCSTIKGQVIKEYASRPNCTKTCNNTIACAQDYVSYGCECPNETVVDEERNECVAPSECPGMSIINDKMVFS